MIGILCEEPTFVYGYNKSVLKNTTVPASNLKGKLNSIAYNLVHEGCAHGERITNYTNPHINPSDLVIKSIPSGNNMWKFFKMLLHHIYVVGMFTRYFGINEKWIMTRRPNHLFF